MKLNKTGNYIVTEGEDFIIDPITKEKMLFLLDKEHRIVIRSLLQEDIKPFIQRFDVTSKEKKNKKRILYKTIPQKGSELYFFAIEKIVGEEKNKRWNEIYELERVPIGIGARMDGYVTLSENIGPSIEFYIYTGEEKFSFFVKEMVEKLAKMFGIEGKSTILPVKN